MHLSTNAHVYAPLVLFFFKVLFIFFPAGMVNLGQMLAGMYFAIEVLEGYKYDDQKLQTFCFMMLLSVSLLSILVQREVWAYVTALTNFICLRFASAQSHARLLMIRMCLARYRYCARTC